MGAHAVPQHAPLLAFDVLELFAMRALFEVAGMVVTRQAGVDGNSPKGLEGCQLHTHDQGDLPMLSGLKLAILGVLG